MPDTPLKPRDPDAIPMAASGEERHDAEAFASRHGITPTEARELFARFGSDRDELEMEVQRLKRL